MSIKASDIITYVLMVIVSIGCHMLDVQFLH